MTCKQLSFLPEAFIEISHEDCLDAMRRMDDNNVDCIITDPPYGLNFMGKKWDSKVPNIDIWKEALRICKSGSHLLAFGGSRTHHHLMIALEQAGWEIRDVIMWLYGSGFPKSHNKFGFEGYGTSLKPAYEPIIMAMKPLDGTFAKNAEKWGVAGINIDECRIETVDNTGRPKGEQLNCYGKFNKITSETHPKGRWPANIILDEEAAEMLDQISGKLISKWGKQGNSQPKSMLFGEHKEGITQKSEKYIGDSGGASRFFYCAKASSSERGEGNNHPTVKPLALMRYLLKLIMPPNPNAVVLDPFMGSGTTGIACKQLNISFIGIEKEQEYYEIAKARIA